MTISNDDIGAVDGSVDGPRRPTTTGPEARRGPSSAAARRALGAYGERVAARHLGEAGLVVLDRNWRCSEGELDLVLRDGDVLVACEVKTRSSDDCGSPLEAVGTDRLERLHRLAWRWAEAHDLRPTDVRVDVVAVRRRARGASEVDHVRGLA